MSTTEGTRQEPASVRYGRRFVPRKFQRSYIPRDHAASAGLFRRAVRWLLPWQLSNYPGVGRGAFEALGGRLTVGSIGQFMKDRQQMSRATAFALREAIRVRVESGLALMVELDKIADQKPRAHVGFMRVDAVTGLSGRTDVGKRRQIKGA